MSDATHRNILAIKSHSEDTRHIVRSLQERIVEMEKTIEQFRSENIILKTQVQTLQVKIFSGGTTNGNNN